MQMQVSVVIGDLYSAGLFTQPFLRKKKRKKMKRITENMKMSKRNFKGNLFQFVLLLLLDPRTPSCISATALLETTVVVKWRQPRETGQTTASFKISFVGKNGGKTLVRNVRREVSNEYSESIDGLRPATNYVISILAFKVEKGVMKTSDVSTCFVETLQGEFFVYSNNMLRQQRCIYRCIFF